MPIDPFDNGSTEVETEVPDLPILEELAPQPRFKTSKRTNKIVGIITLVVALVGIGVITYLSFR